MIGSRAAIRYAKAVLNLALDLKKEEIVDADMQLIASTIEENNDLQIMLDSAVIKVAAKKDVLHSIFDKKIDATSIGLINLLVENRRLAMLGEVAKQYILLYNINKGSQVAEVITAVPLSGNLEDKVLAVVKKITGKSITIENKIDPSIIGGFILRVGDKQFDASIIGKMNNLRRAFEDNAYVGKI